MTRGVFEDIVKILDRRVIEFSRSRPEVLGAFRKFQDTPSGYNQFGYLLHITYAARERSSALLNREPTSFATSLQSLKYGLCQKAKFPISIAFVLPDQLECYHRAIFNRSDFENRAG